MTSPTPPSGWSVTPTPTWLDYIRHNNRMTQDDATIPQRLHELHQGPGLPVVRRMIERQTGAHAGGSCLDTARLGRAVDRPVARLLIRANP